MSEMQEDQLEKAELVEPAIVDPGLAAAGELLGTAPAVSEPAKVMRIGAMIRTLLDEVRQAELDEASRDRMREIYERLRV